MAHTQGTADRDSQVPSSASDNDSDMFPTADNPITGQSLAASRPADTAEVSPPLSQDGPTQNDHILQLDEAMDTGVGPSQSSNSVINTMQFGTTVSQDSEHKRVPGSAWDNRKAKDDYARAMDMVVDKTFNLKEYGEPFVDTVAQQGAPEN